ncbi:hypothetical protein PG984_006127 [Apiospora sp. TS-2023a]
MAQPNAHTGHLAIYSPDLRLNHASLAPYADLLCRRQSPFVAATLTRTRDIVERLLVVLFGLLRGYRRYTEIHWLWSTVTRQWLQLNVATSTETSRVKRLIQVVIQARRIKKSRMVIQAVAQTHPGRLVDTWDAHLRGFYTRPIGSNPTPDRQMVNSWRQAQAIVDGNIRSVPHIIFGINQPLGNNQVTTAIDPNVAAQSAAEAPTGTTQSAALAAADDTTGSAQSSVSSIATATSADTIQSDGLATATTASAAAGSSINSGSEATQGEVDDGVDMPLPAPAATQTEPESSSASGSGSTTGSVSGSVSSAAVDATASGSVSPTASSTDEMERAQAEKQQSQG